MGTLWPFLTLTHTVLLAEKRVRAKIFVSRILILLTSALFALPSPVPYLHYLYLQRLQLATPAYKIKKEKREAKAADSTPSKETEEFVDPASVAVIGAIDSQGTVKSAASAPTTREKA